MELFVLTFLFALTSCSAAHVNTTITHGGNTSKLFWPEPEGLPTGWNEGEDVTRAGPFGRVLQLAGTSQINIYYPETFGQRGLKHPIVFFKHGFTSHSRSYRGIVDRLASHGFVVVADDKGGVSPLLMAQMMEETIAWFMTYTRGSGTGLFNRNNLDISRIGITGHSMGGGCSTFITDTFGKPNHPLAGIEPDFRFRGGAPCQPWTIGGQSKQTEAPIMVTGGLRDTTVPPNMYRGIFSRSADLKVLVEFNDGHGAPGGNGAQYTPQITDFMYAALLGDQSRWYTYWPRN